MGVLNSNMKYSNELMGHVRVGMGYDRDDSSNDNEIVLLLNGEDNFLKFVDDGVVEVGGVWYVDETDYQNVMNAYGDLLDKSVQIGYWFENQGINVDELLATLPTAREINEDGGR